MVSVNGWLAMAGFGVVPTLVMVGVGGGHSQRREW
jgi:hypothetical protein